MIEMKIMFQKVKKLRAFIKKYIDIFIYILYRVFPFLVFFWVENWLARFTILGLTTFTSIILKINAHNNRTLFWVSRLIYNKLIRNCFFAFFYLLAIAPTIIKLFSSASTELDILDILAESFITNIASTTACLFIVKYIKKLISDEELNNTTRWKTRNELLSGAIGGAIPFGAYIFISLGRDGFDDNWGRMDLIGNWFFLIILLSFLAIFLSLILDIYKEESLRITISQSKNKIPFACMNSAFLYMFTYALSGLASDIVPFERDMFLTMWFIVLFICLAILIFFVGYLESFKIKNIKNFIPLSALLLILCLISAFSGMNVTQYNANFDGRPSTIAVGIMVFVLATIVVDIAERRN